MAKSRPIMSQVGQLSPAAAGEKSIGISMLRQKFAAPPGWSSSADGPAGNIIGPNGSYIGMLKNMTGLRRITVV
jgi:hypothetical protein